ncbi:Chromosome 1 open reading frame 65 [Nesidiocoris tenuis]|uniref:Chromosome 1 open reading frame 65 n=1 Tax=Nesidiocoris tenuis TaxID=355587 RepID=A0ABN7AN67_9HEMI|nr:Chromosome 1 open reading frame 65 [Nesidiocoris tenuis]
MSVPNLNLINFEHPASKKSSFILTSPKSLRACQKAGIKPVELLYKSLADVKREVGKKAAQDVYKELEKERQQKLERCRKIRNELLMEGYPRFSRKSSITPAGQSPTSAGQEIDSPKTITPVVTEQDVQAIQRHEENCNERFEASDQPAFWERQPSIFTDFPQIDDRFLDRDLTASTPHRHQGDTAVQEQADFNSHHQLPEILQTKSPPIPALKKSISNPLNLDETQSKSSGKATSSHSTNSRKGKHKKKYVRSHSLPSRAETAKETCSSTKTDNAAFRTASSLGNYSGTTPRGANSTKGKNIHDRSRSVLSQEEMPLIEKKLDYHVSFDDINNNRFKSPTLLRPSSARSKRNTEKRRTLECQKVYDKILAQYKDPEYCLLKYRQIIGNSVERELKEQEVKSVQRRIEEGYEMWQDKVLLLQWLDSERADEQVTRRMAAKIEKMRQKQRNKEIVHAINLNKVKEEDDIRAEILRRELAKKERKIQILHEEKERVVTESKSRALAVSDLKEQIRNIMTPETFDQKVNKCCRNKGAVRVLYPPTLCPNIMQQSHITLG